MNKIKNKYIRRALILPWAVLAHLWVVIHFTSLFMSYLLQKSMEPNEIIIGDFFKSPSRAVDLLSELVAIAWHGDFDE